MIEYKYHFTGEKPTESEVFADATEAELRVLVALIDKGCCGTDEELCQAAGVSRARLGAGIALWEEAGIIAEGEVTVERGAYGNLLMNEFSENPLLSDLDEESSKEVARTIRRSKLHGLYEEIQVLLERPALTPMETKKIAALVSQYGLSEEYILALAAHMADKGKLTVNALTVRVKSLIEKGITTPDELAVYLCDRESDFDGMYDYIRIFSTGSRKTSKAELGYLKKWSKEYCFGVPVVSLAYDLATVTAGKFSFAYLDKIITDWHESGAKTLEECEARFIEWRRVYAEEEDKKREQLAEKTGRRTAKKEKPRYGDFDPEEAMKRALSRSFFDESCEDK